MKTRRTLKLKQPTPVQVPPPPSHITLLNHRIIHHKTWKPTRAWLHTHTMFQHRELFNSNSNNTSSTTSQDTRSCKPQKELIKTPSTITIIIHHNTNTWNIITIGFNHLSPHGSILTSFNTSFHQLQSNSIIKDTIIWSLLVETLGTAVRTNHILQVTR